MVIRTLVKADSEEEALERGIEVGETLEKREIFDYFNLFIGDGAERRWGNLPPATRCDTEEGKEIIAENMEFIKKSFMEKLAIAKKTIEDKTPEEMFNSFSLRNNFRYISETAGSSVWLYNEYGEGILNNRDLEEAIEDPEGCWIVPMDVHY